MNTASVMNNELIKINLLLFSLDTLNLYILYLKLAASFEYKQSFDNGIVSFLLYLLHQITRTEDYVNFTWPKISEVFLINNHRNPNEELLIFNLLFFCLRRLKVEMSYVYQTARFKKKQ